MGSRMELVAGDVQEILIVVATDDRVALGDTDRFRAYLSLSGGIDPDWLDYFAEAARAATDRDAPVDFIDARTELGAGSDESAEPDSELSIERVDPTWISAVAAIPDITLDGVAGGWIARIEEEVGALAREEKPWIRELTGELVRFCRTAARAPDVVFLWSL